MSKAGFTYRRGPGVRYRNKARGLTIWKLSDESFLFHDARSQEYGACRPREEGNMNERRLDTFEWVDYCRITRMHTPMTAELYQNTLAQEHN